MIIISNFIDITGKTFGRLTVIKRVENNKDRRAMWECQCSCGNKIITLGKTLRNGGTTSCGCYKRENISKIKSVDITNKKFGKLVALEKINDINNKNFGLWKCKCDCGNITYVKYGNLVSYNTSSCGCIRTSIGESNIENILKQNNIKYISQYTETNLHRKKYDFAILDDNNNIIRLIEFDGEQHYTYRQKSSWNTYEHYKKVCKRDEEKNQWAEEHNIPLVRIPYWRRDNLILEDLLTDTYLVKKNAMPKWLNW